MWKSISDLFGFRRNVEINDLRAVEPLLVPNCNVPQTDNGPPLGTASAGTSQGGAAAAADKLNVLNKNTKESLIDNKRDDEEDHNVADSETPGFSGGSGGVGTTGNKRVLRTTEERRRKVLKSDHQQTTESGVASNQRRLASPARMKRSKKCLTVSPVSGVESGGKKQEASYAKYTEAFKKMVCEKAKSPGSGYLPAGREFGVPESTIRNWCSKQSKEVKK